MGELAQPLEVTDFSGGITENILDGDPRRYAVADNFLITNDKKLRSRPAFVPLANGNAAALPWGTQRTTSMFSWINETLLVAQSEKNFAWYNKANTAWTQINGISGNPALSGASIYAQTTYAEFQKQIIVTSDGGIDPYGSLPVNIYQNSSNTWVARTAGLPRSYSIGNYTYSSLLNQCITIANAIRSSMISHFSDSLNRTWLTLAAFSQVPFSAYQTDYLHFNPDNIALSYFQNVTFVANEPNNLSNPPTPTPAATDQNSLYTLIGALNSAYGLHIADATIGSYNENPGTSGSAHLFASTAFTANYHFPIAFIGGVPPVKGPLAPLNNSSLPVFPSDTTKQLASLISVAGQLDDLNQKWYWHQLSINTHDRFNQFTKINRYLTDQPTIGTVLSGNGSAIVTPDYTDFINYVNNLVTIYNGHIGVNGPHTQQANALVSVKDSSTPSLLDTNIYLPPASDLNSAYLLIYWLRAQYFIHYLDASVTDFSTFTCNSTTAGSASIPSPVFPASGIVASVGQWVFNSRIDNGGVFNRISNSNIITATYGIETLAAQVLAVSTNWTVDRSFLNSGFTKNFQISSSKYHSFNQNGVLGSTTTTQTTTNEALASGPTAVASSLSTWMALASEMFNALGNHAFNVAVHASNSDLATTLPAIPVYQVNANDIWSKQSIQKCSPAFFVPPIATYSYAFCYSYTYSVGAGGVQYTVRSNPVLSASISAPTSFPVGATIATTNANLYPSVTNKVVRGASITALPQLSNTSETNYDVSNVKIEVYRTTSGGTVYYLNNSLTNGTANYTDSANDTLQVGNFGPQSLQTPLYTTGGIVGSDAPPKSKFVHLLNGVTYYGAVVDSGQLFPQRIRQSVQLAPEWAPATFSDDLDDDITALTSAKDNLIAGCKNSIYRINGGFTPSGQGAITHERISDSIGMMNAKSVVVTEIGVFFAGNDGFYYTDGYQIIKISLEFDRIYQTFVKGDAQRNAIYGSYDKTTRRIWWSIRTSQNETDNSVFYIFYLNYGVKPSGVFTTASNYPYLRPSSHVFQQGVQYIGHELGFVLNSDQDQKQDYVVSAATSPTNWSRTAIPWNFVWCGISMGTTFKRKWLTKLHVVGSNVGNGAIQVSAIRDMNADGKGISLMTPINYTDNVMWGTPICLWGDPTQIWNNTGKMDVWRRFPQTALRADFMQIQLTPAKIAVYASSVGYPFGANVVVDSSAKTATLQTPAGYSSLIFMPDVIGYSIAFQNDGYVNEFPITGLTGDPAVGGAVITYADSTNKSTSGTLGWVIRGVKKEQRIEISSMVIHYMLRGDKVTGYPGKTSDSGAGNAGENPT